VQFASEDRIFANDINQLRAIIRDFSFVNQVNGIAARKAIQLNEGYESFFI